MVKVDHKDQEKDFAVVDEEDVELLGAAEELRDGYFIRFGV